MSTNHHHQHPHNHPHEYDTVHEHADWHTHDHDPQHPHVHGGINDYMKAVAEYRKTFASKQDVLEQTPDPAVREMMLRLEQLVNYCDEHPHTLIVLDEILKGTNSADKLNGSRMFLEYISQREVTGIIATHDLELSRIADEQPERFDNWCFEIELGAAVTYSYKSTRGVARNQNATFLLKERVLRREKGKGKSEE